MPGLFITLEGTEGAGKSTAVSFITEYFNNRNIKYESVREPGGTKIAEKIREILKTPSDEKMSDITELLLMYAARAQLVSTFIKPKLEAGISIISDRFDLSTIAYQGGGRGMATELLDTVRKVAIGDFRPDLTILMDIDPVAGMQRAKSRGGTDRFEQEQIDFFERVRNTYYAYAKEHTDFVAIVDASQDKEGVKRQIFEILDRKIKC